jgi:hypothetical protein
MDGHTMANLGKNFVGYGIYQTTQAFRKLK